jgi:phage protein U
MHLMALGMYVFEIPALAYDELQRKTSYSHAKTGRVGARDAVQFIGPGPETISVTGSVYAEIADGRTEIDTLRDMAAEGEAWPLVDGSGHIFGEFVIEGVDERHKHMMQDGRPRRIDFALDLYRVEDPALETADESPAA